MERRDFTINAIARRLETGEILDPLGGRADLERRILRTTGPASFRDDPLRIVRGLRFVSQLDVDPDEDTLRQMREWAPRIEHVSGERIGGGLAADGMGELSKLLLGAHPAKALRLARDTGVLVHVLPEFAPAIGYEQQSGRQHLTLDEHVFAVVQAAADAGAPLRGAPRGAAARPRQARGGARRWRPRRDRRRDRRPRGAPPAALSDEAARVRRQARAGAPVRGSRTTRGPSMRAASSPATASASRFDLLAHRAADLAGKTPCRRASGSGSTASGRSSSRSGRSRTGSPTWPSTGSDLIELGYSEGPELGQTLRTLLDEVVEEPERNEREQLLDAREELRVIRWDAVRARTRSSSRRARAASAKGRTRRSTSAG